MVVCGRVKTQPNWLRSPRVNCKLLSWIQFGDDETAASIKRCSVASPICCRLTAQDSSAVLLLQQDIRSVAPDRNDHLSYTDRIHPPRLDAATIWNCLAAPNHGDIDGCRRALIDSQMDSQPVNRTDGFLGMRFCGGDIDICIVFGFRRGTSYLIRRFTSRPVGVFGPIAAYRHTSGHVVWFTE